MNCEAVFLSTSVLIQEKNVFYVMTSSIISYGVSPQMGDFEKLQNGTGFIGH